MRARRTPRRLLGLQAKVVIGLVAIALVPLAVSAMMVKGVAEVAQSVAIGEADRYFEALNRSRPVYVEAIEGRKAAFRDAAALAATDPHLATVCTQGSDEDATAELTRLLAEDPWLGAATLTRVDGTTVTVERDLPREGRLARVEVARHDHALREAPLCGLSLLYISDSAAQVREGMVRLGEVLKEHKDLQRIRRQLPPNYRTAYLALVGGFVTVLTILGIAVARRTTKRIDRLVAGTHRVAEGDLESRVDVGGHDELGDLGRAFDEMVAQLRRSQTEIAYLQKIGAWQEIARRLAHEIKNPLTPIQLAVQQLHTKYDGNDPRFRKMLDDANEIVSEEIAGLRRLVDAFSGFAKLPRVEPKPLDLAVVVDDVAREHEVEIVAPSRPVTVAADRLLLKRALVNLVENAMQAGAKRVRISWRSDFWAYLSVDDDGPGIPETLRDRLFDPYVTTKPHGTGLGLAIVKKTILEHGGEITLARKSNLGGARFELTLPLA